MEMCEYLYPIVQDFHLCEKKTDRETNTNLRIDCLDKPEGGGALIFFVRGADVYWRFQKIYPQ